MTPPLGDDGEPVLTPREWRAQLLVLSAALGVIVLLAVLPRCERETPPPPPQPRQVELGPWVVGVPDAGLGDVRSPRAAAFTHGETP